MKSKKQQSSNKPHFTLIQGDKGRKADQSVADTDRLQPETLEDYYDKNPPTASDKDQAEGDEETVNNALKNDKQTNNSAA